KLAGVCLYGSRERGSGPGADGDGSAGPDSDGPEAAVAVGSGAAETDEGALAPNGSGDHDGPRVDRVRGGRDEARGIRLHRKAVPRGKDAAPVAAHGRKSGLVAEKEFLRERVNGEESLDGIVGASANIQDVLRMISRLKDTRTPVLIAGESGTGKELVARAIHFRGALAQSPFVAVDC